MHRTRWMVSAPVFACLFALALWATPNNASAQSPYALQPASASAGPIQRLSTLEVTPFSSNYQTLGNKGVLGVTNLGTMTHGLVAGEPWFWSTYLGGPAFAVGLVLMIGNLSILFDRYERSVYMGWGIAGVIWGVLGTAASVVALLLDLSNTATNLSPNPIPNLIAFNVFNAALNLTVLGLGIASIIKGTGKNDPALLAWSPMIQPDSTGNVQMGLMFHGKF
ncbi:MAG: hypothetical protein EP343_28305 [Deltaproteobacteria bacterium]|nr:MAG: hypothetical protein EP343_28305 [Deltaproteobacteria bacterium]